MRDVHRALVIAATLAVSMAVLAGSVSAQSLRANDEASGDACPAAVSVGNFMLGGCHTHLTSEGSVELRKHLFGIESHVTACDIELTVRLAGTASGYAYEQIFTGTGCTRQACAIAGVAQTWLFEGAEGNALEGEQFMTAGLCLEPTGGGTDEKCEIDLPFDTYSNQHTQEYGHATELAAHDVTGFRCELVGHWASEVGGVHDGVPEQEIVVTHPSALRVDDEATGSPCPAVTKSGTDVDGGCLTHITSEGGVAITRHALGIEVALGTCNFEFSARLDGGSAGYIVEQSLTGPGCTNSQPCVDGTNGNTEPTPWRVTGLEGTASIEGDKWLATEFCLVTSFGSVPCELELPIDSYSSQHRQEYGHAAELPAQGTASPHRCEMTGHWASETGGTHDGAPEQEIVISH